MIREGYPFYEYVVEEKPVPAEIKRVSDLLLNLFLRRLTIKEFANLAGVALSGEHLRRWQAFIDGIDPATIGKPTKTERTAFERSALEELLELSRFRSAREIAEAAIAAAHSYRVVQPLFDDPEIEEIMINGIDRPIFVHHRKLGICRTNLTLSEKDLHALASQCIARSGAPFDDARLPDGSRLNIVWPPAVEQPVITIRKFRAAPFSLIDLIANGTLSAELAAFLWLCVDGMRLFPLNILIAGGTASGKTTTLNVLSTLIPPEERIITVEMVRELNLYSRENWLPLETTREADLTALLINALRMRPDRIIVGEIRGSEAEALFTAMNVGHRGTFGTMHANSARDAITRLESAPMNVPRALIPLIDLILIQHRVYHRQAGLIRRITQVCEVSRIEERIALNEIFSWDAKDDAIKRSDLPSQSIEKIASVCGLTIAELNKEVERRERALREIVKRGATAKDVVALVAQWWRPERLAKGTGEGLGEIESLA